MDSYDLMLTTILVLSASYSMTLFIVAYLIWWVIQLKRSLTYTDERAVRTRRLTESNILPFSQEEKLDPKVKPNSRTMWD